MKLLGCILLLTTSAVCGTLAANRLHAHTRRLQLLIRLVNDMMQRLRYALPTVDSLIAELCAQPCYRTLSVLQAYEQTSPDMAFTDRFSEAVAAASYSEEEKSILLQIGTTLGSTDLEGQLSALTLCKTRLESLLLAATERQQTHATLYRSMGLLGGLFLVILMI